MFAATQQPQQQQHQQHQHQKQQLPPQQSQPQQQQPQQHQVPNTAATTISSAQEEALKSNTDCVYFLASPLTCKKVCLFILSFM